MSFKAAVIIDDAMDISHLEKRLKEINVEYWRKNCKTEQDIINTAKEADFIITIIFRFPYTRFVLENLKKLRFIETMGAGYDGVDLEVCAELGIGVIANTDYHLEEVSDHAFALLMACSRQIVRVNGVIKGGPTGVLPGTVKEVQAVWPGMTRLRGKTLGLIGFGRVARLMAHKAKGFGMNILAYDPYVSDEAANQCGAQKADFNRILEESDFVSIHSGLTAETRHLFGLEQFKRMKTTAHVINTARGEIIDHTALGTALKEGLIAGAGLDVYEPEPLPPDSPLLKLDNIILTGHSAHYSPDNIVTRFERPSEEISRILHNEWPIGLVNPEVKEKYLQKWGSVSI